MVHETEEKSNEVTAVHQHVVALPGERVGDPELGRCLIQAVHRIKEYVLQIGESIIAGSIRGAALEKGIKGAVRVGRQVHVEGDVGWIDGIEHHAAQAVGIVAHDAQRQARAVRGAPQVHLVVTQRQPQVLDIGGVGRAVIVRQVSNSIQVLLAIPNCLQKQLRCLVLCEQLAIHLHVEQVQPQLGYAGAVEGRLGEAHPALVEEDEVATLGQDRGKEDVKGQEEVLESAAPRPAGQVDDRVRMGGPTGRVKDGHSQPEGAAVRVGAVLGYAQVAAVDGVALNLARRQLHGAGHLLEGRGLCRGLGRRGGNGRVGRRRGGSGWRGGGSGRLHHRRRCSGWLAATGQQQREREHSEQDLGLHRSFSFGTQCQPASAVRSKQPGYPC